MAGACVGPQLPDACHPPGGVGGVGVTPVGSVGASDVSVRGWTFRSGVVSIHRDARLLAAADGSISGCVSVTELSSLLMVGGVG